MVLSKSCKRDARIAQRLLAHGLHFVSRIMHQINWFEITSRSISSKLHAHPDCAEKITERLSALFLERLSRPTSEAMFDLLPEAAREKNRTLQASADSDSDPSIGYTSFVERAAQVMGCTGEIEDQDETARQIADAFLWAVTQEIPPELKTRMTEELPAELRSRADLYTAHSDEAKVA
jgi:hypothetical protein